MAHRLPLKSPEYNGLTDNEYAQRQRHCRIAGELAMLLASGGTSVQEQVLLLEALLPEVGIVLEPGLLPLLPALAGGGGQLVPTLPHAGQGRLRVLLRRRDRAQAGAQRLEAGA